MRREPRRSSQTRPQPAARKRRWLAPRSARQAGHAEQASATGRTATSRATTTGPALPTSSNQSLTRKELLSKVRDAWDVVENADARLVVAIVEAQRSGGCTYRNIWRWFARLDATQQTSLAKMCTLTVP